MKLSKSKLALAKVINENGGWVDDSANWAVQPKHEEGDIWFSSSDNKPYRNEGLDSFIFDGRGLWLRDVIKHNKLHQNWHQCVLSREEYHQAYPEVTEQDAICLDEAINMIDGGDNPKADADGWIEWKGGECPVGKNVTGDIKLACGEKFDTTDMAMWNWHLGNGNPRSIIAYRPHKPEVKPEFCESVIRSIPDPELRPTIEQLAQDYRNAKDYADRLQKDADEACAKADSILCQIERAGEEIGFIMNPIKGD